ncbi:MAG: hypothetical protein PHO20_01940 [Candidatus Peribacteraceae bacterium]|nr:hypothetical protein [Candidatus Peribacteraceae bacterium]MDD5739505.1 hypothetical protein [Candidatus Peribacteraceae bacterium]
MVYFDVFAGRTSRVYPPLPLPERLQLWLDRVDRHIRRFKRPRKLFLPRKFVEALGLPNNIVELDALGRLWSGSDIIARTGG